MFVCCLSLPLQCLLHMGRGAVEFTIIPASSNNAWQKNYLLAQLILMIKNKNSAPQTLTCIRIIYRVWQANCWVLSLEFLIQLDWGVAWMFTSSQKVGVLQLRPHFEIHGLKLCSLQDTCQQYELTMAMNPNWWRKEIREKRYLQTHTIKYIPSDLEGYMKHVFSNAI